MTSHETQWPFLRSTFWGAQLHTASPKYPANQKMREDPRMKDMGDMMDFVDGKRMIFGGFAPLMDKRSAA